LAGGTAPLTPRRIGSGIECRDIVLRAARQNLQDEMAVAHLQIATVAQWVAISGAA
jgi:hypothetical protein